MSLQGRVAFVTGGARGIGEAIVRRLHADGAKVMIADLDTERAGSLASQLGEGTVAQMVNVTDPTQVDEAVKACVEQLGGLDILVNNAGITRDGLLMRMKEEDWDAVLSINLKSAYLTSKAAVRTLMRSKAGRIINMASVVGIAGNAGQANYAASKAGLIGLTKTLAKELSSRAITANAVAPGFIKTDMTAKLKESVVTEILSRIGMGRMGDVEEVAALVAFLAGPDAAYITGQVFAIDGGLAM